MHQQDILQSVTFLLIWFHSKQEIVWVDSNEDRCIELSTDAYQRVPPESPEIISSQQFMTFKVRQSCLSGSLKTVRCFWCVMKTDVYRRVTFTRMFHFSEVWHSKCSIGYSKQHSCWWHCNQSQEKYRTVDSHTMRKMFDSGRRRCHTQYSLIVAAMGFVWWPTSSRWWNQVEHQYVSVSTNFGKMSSLDW